jgi:hypothetical protein
MKHRLFRRIALAFLLPLFSLTTLVTAGSAQAKAAPNPHFNYARTRAATNGDLLANFRLTRFGQPSSMTVQLSAHGLTTVWNAPDGSQLNRETPSFAAAYLYCNEPSACDAPLPNARLTTTLTLSADPWYLRGKGYTLSSATYSNITLMAFFMYPDGTGLSAQISPSPSTVSWP